MGQRTSSYDYSSTVPWDAYTMSDPRGMGSPAFRFDTAMPILIMLNTTVNPSR
jgi:hypothetical protein